MKITILPADLRLHQAHILRLFRDYLEWVHPQFRDTLELVFDIEAMWPQFSDLTKFTPPRGKLFVAVVDDVPVACVCLRHFDDHSGEIKRLYVAPAFRRQGIAKSLIKTVIHEAGRLDYRRLYLDSPPFMTDAHALYHAMGFHDIPPYEKHSIPQAFQDTWRFMVYHPEAY